MKKKKSESEKVSANIQCDRQPYWSNTSNTSNGDWLQSKMTYEYEYELNDRLSRTAQYDGVVSISLNDSWTGKKILESLRQTPLKRVRSDDLEVVHY